MNRPVTVRGDHGVNLFVLVVAMAVVGASMVFTASEQWVFVLGWQLPEVCTLRRVLGISCPGCGLTRSFVFMGHGDPLTALRMNWLGPVFWTVIAAQIPLRIWKLVRPLR